MKFRYCSDIHLEFYKKYKFPHHEDDINSYLILAGDVGIAISNSRKIHPSLVNFLLELKPKFKGIIYVSGNHEYYNNICKMCHCRLKKNCKSNPNCNRCLSIDQVDKIIKKSCEEIGVIFLQKESLLIEDVMIHGCTLFSDYLGDSWFSSNDSRKITDDYKKILDVHLDHLEWLKSLELNNKYKNIIVTHFLPVKELILDLNEHAYYTETYEKLKFKDQIDFVICGHSHVNSEMKINNTTFCINAHGYPKEKPVLIKFFEI